MMVLREEDGRNPVIDWDSASEWLQEREQGPQKDTIDHNASLEAHMSAHEAFKHWRSPSSAIVMMETEHEFSNSTDEDAFYQHAFHPLLSNANKNARQAEEDDSQNAKPPVTPTRSQDSDDEFLELLESPVERKENPSSHQSLLQPSLEPSSCSSSSASSGMPRLAKPSPRSVTAPWKPKLSPKSAVMLSPLVDFDEAETGHSDDDDDSLFRMPEIKRTNRYASSDLGIQMPLLLEELKGIIKENTPPPIQEVRFQDNVLHTSSPSFCTHRASHDQSEGTQWLATQFLRKVSTQDRTRQAHKLLAQNQWHATALQILQSLPHSEVALARLYESWAMTVWKEGDFAQALEHLSKSLELRSETLGTRHVDTVDTLQCMARVYASAERWSAAQTCWTAVLQGRRTIFGLHHPGVAVAAHQLANVVRERGKHQTARQLYGLSLQIYERLGVPRRNNAIVTLLQDIKVLQQLQPRGNTTPTRARLEPKGSTTAPFHPSMMMVPTIEKANIKES